MKIDDDSKFTLFLSDSKFPASCCRSRILIAILEHKTEWEYHFYVKQNSLLLKTKNANIVTCCYILFKMENENTLLSRTLRRYARMKISGPLKKYIKPINSK